MTVRIDRVVTKGGDGGQTSLGDGTRVAKDAPRVAAYGTVDEANATLGLLRLHTAPAPQTGAAAAGLGAVATAPAGYSEPGAEPARAEPGAVPACSEPGAVPACSEPGAVPACSEPGAVPALADIDAILARAQNDLFDIGADLCVPGEMGESLRVGPDLAARYEAAAARLNANLPPLNSFVLPCGTPAAAHAHLARTVVRRAEREVVSLAHIEVVNPEVIRALNRLSDLLFIIARVLNAGSEQLWRRGGGQPDEAVP